LRKLYPTTTTKKLAEILVRSPSSVEWKALQLGLRKDEKFRMELLRKTALLATSVRYKLWTKEELSILKALYPKASREELLKALPERTWNSIVLKARELELRREDPRIRMIISKMNTDLQMKPEDVGWFAGIIDGEGTITILNEGAPWISIVNTNTILLEKVQRLLKEWGVPYSVTTRKGKYVDKRGVKHDKATTEIRIIDSGYAYALLTKLLPLLTAKKERASLMMEYIRRKFLEQDREGAKAIAMRFS
jgi:hypothetical protein